MSSNEASIQKTFARIQRYKGKILGALLWIPASIFEKSIEPGQEEIAVWFEDNCINLGIYDATDVQTSAAEAHPMNSTHD